MGPSNFSSWLRFSFTLLLLHGHGEIIILARTAAYIYIYKVVALTKDPTMESWVVEVDQANTERCWGTSKSLVCNMCLSEVL